MRPAVVVLGFVFGSAVAITFALVGTTIVFLTLRAEYPRLGGELRPLLISVGLFALLTAASGSTFYGELKRARWRRGALALLLVMLAAVAAYYASLRA
jgi:hypothetical protein